MKLSKNYHEQRCTRWGADAVEACLLKLSISSVFRCFFWFCHQVSGVHKFQGLFMSATTSQRIPINLVQNVYKNSKSKFAHSKPSQLSASAVLRAWTRSYTLWTFDKRKNCSRTGDGVRRGSAGWPNEQSDAAQRFARQVFDAWPAEEDRNRRTPHAPFHPGKDLESKGSIFTS